VGQNEKKCGAFLAGDRHITQQNTEDSPCGKLTMPHANMLNGALATPMPSPTPTATFVPQAWHGGVSGVRGGTLTFLEQCAASEAEAMLEFKFQFEFMWWRLA